MKTKIIEEVEEGKYNGTITNFIIRTLEKYGFDYADFTIKIDDKQLELKTSFPANISIFSNGNPSSNLAKFISTMGEKISEKGDNVKLCQNLIGRKVSFLIKDKTTEKGTYKEIVQSSIKPI